MKIVYGKIMRHIVCCFCNIGLIEQITVSIGIKTNSKNGKKVINKKVQNFYKSLTIFYNEKVFLFFHNLVVRPLLNKSNSHKLLL